MVKTREIPVGPAARLFEAAQNDLWRSWRDAEQSTDHPGIRGDIREDGFRTFLSSKLGGQFRVSTGEAVDAASRTSKQLDAIISSGTGFVLRSGSNVLLPAESVLAVVEVKSTLTNADLLDSAVKAQSVRDLRPHGEAFVGRRLWGEPGTSSNARCFFTTFAYKSDLVEPDWLAREWGRASRELSGRMDLIDRIVVLERGMLNLPSARGMTGTAAATLWKWFEELDNFLRRETARRDQIEWWRYAAGFGEIWTQLDDPPEPVGRRRGKESRRGRRLP